MRGLLLACGERWPALVGRALVLAALLGSLPAAQCVLGTDIVADAFNEGAIDTSGGDPWREPRAVARDTVARRIYGELIDGYFHMGAGSHGDLEVAAWLRELRDDPERFYRQVARIACAQQVRIGERCPEEDKGCEPPPSMVQQQATSFDLARLQVVDSIADWAPRPVAKICGGHAVRDDRALVHFVDYLRFTAGMERAIFETADLMIEGLADRAAILDGARLAFDSAARYLQARQWQRRLDHHTTGLVVKGGAVNGIYSAGVVWVVLQLIAEYTAATDCEQDDSCPRVDLVSGTSTGAFIAAAVDKLATAKTDGERRQVIAKIPQWFTCFGLDDMYCLQDAALTSLVSKQNGLQGVLRFDGLREILERELSPADLLNPTEVIVNTVDFRSGRLFALSDQNRAELGSKSDVIDGILASAVLPLIVEPIARLPVNPTTGEDAVYLDGGIRSELPVLPLVHRGAERVLIASSSASVLQETGRLTTALQIATRYIDVSTGGVTEGELAHAKRRVESVRLAEVTQCRDMLHKRPAHRAQNGFSHLCQRNDHCDRSALCAGRYQAEELCGKRKKGQPSQAPESEPEPEPSPGDACVQPEQKDASLLAPRLQIRELWKLMGIFRDERTVESVHGYTFNPADQRRLFMAGAESARRRCLEIASLLGIDTSAPGMRAKVVGWCSPNLPLDTCKCFDEHREDTDRKSLRVCGDEDSQAGALLDQCKAQAGEGHP